MQKTLTPAMAQFYELKEQNPDSILWFRMGDFYEMFDEDAHIAHRVLGINVTTRNKNAENPQPLAGIPYHAKDKYLPGLVNAGYKVAIAEQVSDPKAKWIVNREIVRVVTPATLNLEGESYTDNKANYILSIVEQDEKFWISILDPSSGKWKTWELNDFSKLQTEIYKIAPKEVILEKKLFGRDDIKEILEKKYSLNIYYFELKTDSREKLINHFWVKDLWWFNLEESELSRKASAIILEYLESVQKTNLDYLDSISVETFSDFMDLDESTIKSLDLLYNFASKSSKLWTLFWVMDKTKTAMWRRFLRESIVKPLQDIDEINKRQDIIEEFLKDSILLDKVTTELKQVADLDNILTRLALWRANPRDLIALKNSLITILWVFEMIKNSWNEKLVKLLGIS